MSEETKTNGAAATPAITIPEGDRYLLIRLGKANDLAVVFSSPLDGLALLKIADEWFTQNITIPSTRPQQPAAVQIPPGLDLGSLGRAIRRSKQ